MLLLIFEEIIFVPFEIPLKTPSFPHDLKNMVNKFSLKIYETHLELRRRK